MQMKTRTKNSFVCLNEGLNYSHVSIIFQFVVTFTHPINVILLSDNFPLRLLCFSVSTFQSFLLHHFLAFLQPCNAKNVTKEI